MVEWDENGYRALRERFEQCLAGAESEYREALVMRPSDSAEVADTAAKRASAFAKITTWQKALAILSSVDHFEHMASSPGR
jgi:hypothetical protein